MLKILICRRIACELMLSFSLLATLNKASLSGCDVYELMKCGRSVVRHLPLVLEVSGSIPAPGEENFGVRTRFL